MQVLPTCHPGHLGVRVSARYPARLLLAILLLGASALLAQVILTRELLSLFLGNELAIALVLAVWLTAVALGSALGARLVSRMREAQPLLAWSQMALAALLPLSLLVSRRLSFGESLPGQVLGPGAMVVASLETLTPICVVLGLQFVLASHAAVARRKPGAGGVASVGLVYALEAVGAVLGGAAFHFYLAERVPAFGALAGLGLLNLASAVALLRPRSPLRAYLFQGLAVALGLGLAVLLVNGRRAELDSIKTSPRWLAFDVLSYSPARYGALTSTFREGQVSIFQSGVLLFTSEDEYANEVTCHLPLLAHPNPGRVLLVGGAFGGLDSEVLKHPVTQVDCVELEPRLAEAVAQFRPFARRVAPEMVPPLDSRARLHFGDARLFVRNARAAYDVIILNVPDPTTAALNRFYTREFFQEVRRALAPGGLVAVTQTGSSHHLSGWPLLAAATTQQTLSEVFPSPALVPGEQMFFLAADRAEPLTLDAGELAERLRVRGIATHHVNEAWLHDALLPFRAELMQEAIQEAQPTRVNTDLNPISYYHQTRIWLDQLRPGGTVLPSAQSGLSFWWAALPIPLALAAAALGRKRRRRLTSAAALTAAAAIGGFGLAVEVLALLAFQSACGYLYYALGALIAAFMAGLAVGAAVATGRMGSASAYPRLLGAALATALAICLLLPGLLAALLPNPLLASLGIGALLVLVGTLVGAAFPIATAAYRGRRAPAAAGGAIYAADLIGSAGAAMVVGTLALPMLGVSGVCHASALVLLTALILTLPLLRGADQGDG